MRHLRHDDRGDIAIEYVIITPMLLLVFGLIYVFGRIADVGGVLDAGTRDAARVASAAPDPAQAQQAARDAVVAAVGRGSQECLRTLTVTLTRDVRQDQQAARGTMTTITVRSRCTYPISDAGLPGAPGSLTVHSTFSSVIDPNRTVG